MMGSFCSDFLFPSGSVCPRLVAFQAATRPHAGQEARKPLLPPGQTSRTSTNWPHSSRASKSRHPCKAPFRKHDPASSPDPLLILLTALGRAHTVLAHKGCTRVTGPTPGPASLVACPPVFTTTTAATPAAASPDEGKGEDHGRELSPPQRQSYEGEGSLFGFEFLVFLSFSCGLFFGKGIIAFRCSPSATRQTSLWWES